MIVTGQDSTSDHRFAWIDAAGHYWNGSTYEPWTEAGAETYMQAATNLAGSNSWQGTPPLNAVQYQLWVWTGALGSSYVWDEEDIPASEVTLESGVTLPATRTLPVRLRDDNDDPFDPVGNVVELISPDGTWGIRRSNPPQTTIIAADAGVGGAPLQYTRTDVGDYEYEIAENGIWVDYGYRYTNPVTGAVESKIMRRGPMPSGAYADTQDVYDELGEENVLITGNLSNDGTNADSPQYIRDSLRFADVRVNVKLGAYSPPPATFPVTSTADWVNDAINEAASKYAAGSLLNKRQKQSNLANAKNPTGGDALILAGDELLQMLIDGGLVGVTLEEEDTDSGFVADAPVAVAATVDAEGRDITQPPRGAYYDPGAGWRWS